MSADGPAPVAVITGGGNGIGRASAVLLAQMGYDIVIADRDLAMANETVQLVEKAGTRGVAAETDVTSTAAIEALGALIDAEFGRLDAAVNGAGITPPSAGLLDVTDDEIQLVFDINVTGMFRCMRMEVARMLASGGGSIVNISSRTGLSGSPRRTTYSASKHAVIGLSRSAALELAEQGIRVNAVCPGPIDTAMISAGVAPSPDRLARLGASSAMNRIGQPEEVAAAIAWLCSPAASYVNGTELAVDGGVARSASGLAPAAAKQSAP